MNKEPIQKLLNALFSNAINQHKGVGTSWFSIPAESKSQVGYDGTNSLLRTPSDIVETTNWKTQNSLMKSRILGSNDSYLLISFDPTNMEILLPFLVEFIDTTDTSEDEPNQILDEMIGKWSNYWNEANPIFGKEEQIGTLGELIVLEELLELNPSLQTLESWSSPKMKDDLHDFEGSDGNLEVKTSSSVPRQFYVSSINQMDHEIIEPKSLTIIFVKLTPGDDFTLPSVVDRIRSKCSEIGISVDFDEMLKKRGYRNFEEDVYAELSFQMDGIDQHIVDSDTPIYTNRELNQIYPAVARINQVVDPNMIDFSTIESADWSDIANRVGI